MFKFETSVLNSEGQPIVGASVSIFAAGSNTLVPLFEDDQTTTKSNPLTTDSTGLVQCKAANGKHDYLVSNLPGGATRRINGIIFDDPTEAGNAGIALSMPGEFAVTGSPGNSITVAKKTQTANLIYAGPTTGLADTPQFRAMVAEDMPVSTQAARGALQRADGAALAARTAGRAVTAEQNGRVMLSSGTITAASTLAVTNLITSTFPNYEIWLENITSSVNDAQLRYNVSTDNGATWLTSGIYQADIASSSNTSGTASTHNFLQNATYGGLALASGSGYNLSNAGAAFAQNGKIVIWNPSSTTAYKDIQSEIHGPYLSAQNNKNIVNGSVNVSTPINAIQLSLSSGTFSGNYRLYGVI